MDDLEELRRENERLRKEVNHWKANHDSAVKKKRKGQEITSAIIAELRDDLEKAHERIAELEQKLGEGE